MATTYVVEDAIGVVTTARLQFFDVSKSTLKEDHKAWLKKTVLPLLQRGGSISLVGLSSRSGKAAFNKALSIKRANAVKDYLENALKMNFAFDLIDGYGEELAESLGQADGIEDGQFRAVMIYVHTLPKPPDPKTIKTPPKMKPKPREESTLWVGIGETQSGDLAAVGYYSWVGTVFRASADENGRVDFATLVGEGWKLGGGLGGSVSAIVVVAHGIRAPYQMKNDGQWSDWDLDLAIGGQLGSALKSVKGIGKIVNTMEKYEKLTHAGIEITKNKGFMKKGLYTIPILGAGAGMHVWTGRKYGSVSVANTGKVHF